MAVFDISEFQQQYEEKQAAEAAPTYSSKKEKLLSLLLARGSFLLLLLFNIACDLRWWRRGSQKHEWHYERQGAKTDWLENLQ